MNSFTKGKFMNVNFEYYKIFYYVARYHNFTKAAKVLGNSQPNVTRAMNCLEQQLGRILFVRTNRGVQLTRDGEQLYSYVEAAMSQLLTAEDELADGENLTHGSIAIGVSETALNIYLLDKLRAFHMAYPGINLKIYNHSTPQAVDEVKNGSIDFAVVTTPADVEAPLKKIMLQSYREILIGGTTFFSLKKQKLSIAEMRNYPMICLGRETMTFRFYDRIFREHGVELAPDTEAATTDQILPLVKSELGLAFMPKPMAEAAIANREIVEIALEEEIPQRNICMVYDIHQPISAAARELKKVISDSHKV